MAVAVTSCKKEKEEDSFLKGQMTDFHGQKAYIDGSNYSCFRQGEAIFVNGRNNCTVSALSNSDRTCNISGAEESEYGYYAFYPANLISATDISSGFSNATVTLPRVQQYAEENGHQVIDNPMAGYLANSSGIIVFNNLCALLKVNVTSNWTLDSIQVTMKGTDLWGTGSVDETNWKIDMDNGATHDTKYETVSLVFPRDGISTSNGMSFYIMVPNNTITADNQAVKVHFFGKYNGTTVHKNYSMRADNSINLNYNKIIKLYDFNLVEVGVGVFTVVPAQNGQPAKKISFARTNIIKSGSTFYFLAEPWSNGENSGNYYYSYNNLINYTTNWEWPVNGYLPHTWRILTTSEWVNVLTLNRGATRNSYWCKVNGKCGLIIYPDGCNLTTPSSHTSNITNTEWANIYESVGCIFLPTHHRYNGSDNNNAAANYNWTENGIYALGIYAMANSNKVCFRFQYEAESSAGYSPKISCGAPIPNTTTANSSGGVTVRLVHDLPVELN